MPDCTHAKILVEFPHGFGAVKKRGAKKNRLEPCEGYIHLFSTLYKTHLWHLTEARRPPKLWVRVGVGKFWKILENFPLVHWIHWIMVGHGQGRVLLQLGKMGEPPLADVERLLLALPLKGVGPSRTGLTTQGAPLAMKPEGAS